MSWHGWSIEAPLLYVALAGLLYWAGGRRRGRPPDPRRALAFWAGLATIVLALDSPMDGWSDQLFWVHMLQHVLLITVAPPLILLGRPWPRMWRALPLGARTEVGRTLARSPLAAPVRRLARPWPAWTLFSFTLLAWHLPGAYNLTLRSNAVHQLEHATFFFTALLFWARVIDPGPLRPRLEWPLRIAYVVAAMVVSWVLAIVFVLLPSPAYSHYADLVHRPGGITAMADQQMAGGMMWVLGSISYSIAIFFGFYRWLEPDSKTKSSLSAIST